MSRKEADARRMVEQLQKLPDRAQERIGYTRKRQSKTWTWSLLSYDSWYKWRRIKTFTAGSIRRR